MKSVYNIYRLRKVTETCIEKVGVAVCETKRDANLLVEILRRINSDKAFSFHAGPKTTVLDK